MNMCVLGINDTLNLVGMGAGRGVGVKAGTRFKKLGMEGCECRNITLECSERYIHEEGTYILPD